MSTTITGTERLAVSLKWSGILVVRPLKIEPPSYNAPPDTAWARRHGARRRSTTQWSKNQRCSPIIPASILQECLQVLILPQNYKPVEFPADCRHWQCQPWSIQGRPGWSHVILLHVPLSYQAMYIVLNCKFLNFGRWWLSHPSKRSILQSEKTPDLEEEEGVSIKKKKILKDTFYKPPNAGPAFFFTSSEDSDSLIKGDLNLDTLNQIKRLLTYANSSV